MSTYANSSNKVMIISLDGGTLDLIKPLTDLGVMPNIKRLMDTGQYGILNSTIQPVTAPAWSSFLTGKNPGKHGIYDFRKYDPIKNQDQFVTSVSIKGKTFWQILSDNGKRVCVINLPMTYPPYKVNGYMISGFDTPSTNSQFTYPETLQAEILSKCPEYKFVAYLGARNLETDHGFNRFVDENSEVCRDLFMVARDLFIREKWDVFMLHVQSTDVMQHGLWGYLTEDRPEKAWKDRRQKALSFYSDLDSHLGTLLKIAGDEYLIIIVSDHGFGKHVGSISVNKLLAEMKLLRVNGQARITAKNIIRNSSLYPIIRGYKKLRMSLKRTDSVGDRKWIDAVRETDISQLIDINWQKTKAYTVMGNLCSFIYVNLEGRQPNGIVKDGEEYSMFITNLQTKLKNIPDPNDGTPLFRQVYKTGEIYSGFDPTTAPDLIAVPKPGYTVMDRFYEHSGFIAKAYRRFSGSHRLEGLIIVKGEGVSQGAEDNQFAVNIIDIAPTILYLQGCAIPKDMDGVPLTHLFSFNNEVRYEEHACSMKTDDSRILSDDDSAAIANRLKDLGYLS